MALKPSGYGRTCTMTMLKAGVAGYSWSQSTMDVIKENFEEDANFRIVYRNMNYSTPLKTWIYEGNASEKTVGYLHLLSYPYNKVSFAIGDYIQFNYGHTDDHPSQYKYWILESLDTRHLYDVHGRMLPCNSIMKWQDKSGNIYSYPCYFNTEMTKTNILDSGQGFTVESGALIAILQQNSDTSTIYVNQRFLINGRTYVVYQYNNNIDKGLLYVYLRITVGVPEDDYESGLAYNGDELISDETLNGDIINISNVQNLLQGATLPVIIYNYSLGQKTDDVFKIITYNVPSQYYSVDNEEGNVFNITNIKQYSRNPLQIDLKNLTTNDITTVYVWLGGVL